jgi:hypothetical protein
MWSLPSGAKVLSGEIENPDDVTFNRYHYMTNANGVYRANRFVKI